MTTLTKIEQAIQDVINGYTTKYVNCYDNEENSISIRISDHDANPQRMGENDLSLVINRIEEENEDDTYYGSSIQRSNKTFTDFSRQYQLNENGDFTEEFYSLEQFLNYMEIK